jgi:hypothetical protein
MSELDQDFEKVAEQINAKIKEAAAALKEVNELREKAGLPSLIYSNFVQDDMLWQNRNSDNPLSRDELTMKMEEVEEKLSKIDVGPLEAELGDAGWSTSSSYC